MWRTEYGLRLGDLDHLGHVTATTFLGLLEEARATWLMGLLDIDYPSYVVVSQCIEYLHEVTMTDRAVTVQLTVAHLGTSSFEVVEAMSTPASLCARSRATLVMWESASRRPRPISTDERALLEPFLNRSDSARRPEPRL